MISVLGRIRSEKVFILAGIYNQSFRVQNPQGAILSGGYDLLSVHRLPDRAALSAAHLLYHDAGGLQSFLIAVQLGIEE